SYSTLCASDGDFTYDLEKGEIYIQNASLFRMSPGRDVYYGCMDYTLEDGRVIEADVNDVVPGGPVAAEDFVNPGGDAWYLLREEKTEDPAQPYVIAYDGTETAGEIPFAALGTKPDGAGDSVRIEILDGEGRVISGFPGEKDAAAEKITFTVPGNLNMKAGSYPIRLTLTDASTGEKKTVDGAAVLEVENDTMGVRLLNSENRYLNEYTGTLTFRFRNGTGENAIREITEVWFAYRDGDGYIYSFDLNASAGDFTYDLEKGEVTVPNSVLFDLPLQEVVYYGGMNYVLNGGQTVEMSLREAVPEESAAPEDFVNPGGDAWYLLPENLRNFHEPIFCPAVEPTCTSPGRTECYRCAICGQYFSDAEGSHKIGEEETVIAQLPHTFGEDWTYDGTGHWHECVCGEKDGEAPHTFGEWVTVREASESEKGMRERACAACGYTETETIAALPGGADPNGGQDDPVQGETADEGQDEPIQADDVKGEQNAQTPGGAAGERQITPEQSGRTNTEAPKTGEADVAKVYSAAMLLAGAGLVFCIIRKKKQKICLTKPEQNGIIHPYHAEDSRCRKA
ncbi:MAG TPA: hypothetical protein IAB52_05285, partial [Candidatus Scatomonas merdavium]|nr:hypothetical protein [Candidatus Scatomonas merdavium]